MAILKHYNKFIISSLIVLSFFAFGERDLFPQQPNPAEYRVKALFLYNFAKFVEWPHSIGDTLNICILGDDPFGAYIEGLEDRPLNEQKVKIRRIEAVRDIKKCQVLFVDSSEDERLDIIVAEATGKGILTVGDSEGNAERGLIIEFYKENSDRNEPFGLFLCPDYIPDDHEPE